MLISSNQNNILTKALCTERIEHAWVGKKQPYVSQKLGPVLTFSNIIATEIK